MKTNLKKFILAIFTILSACAKNSNVSPTNQLEIKPVQIAATTASLSSDNLPTELIYKKIGDVELKMKLYYPATYKKGDRLPAIVLFYGGGWNTASPDQFAGQAKYLAKEGMIAVTADYRVKNIHGTTPFEALDDARSAVAYLRINAPKLGITPGRLAAGGGSAGGHLAAATDLTGSGKADGSNVSCRPNALVLFNPVFNNGPGNYGYDRVGSRYTEFSPYHNIKKGAAPTIVFLGTSDDLVPVSVAQDYKTAMDAVGSRCELYLYDGQEHGFFNRAPYFSQTMEKVCVFLRLHGYLPKKE